MSRHADAEPTIGPTRPARSRTTSVLSPATAPAVPASNPLNKKRVKRAVFANLREAKVTFDRSAHMSHPPIPDLSPSHYGPGIDVDFCRRCLKICFYIFFFGLSVLLVF